MMLRRIALVMVCVSALWGCAGSDQDELVQWMAEQRNATRPRIKPIPEPKNFAPQAYNQEASTDPFSNQKLTQALRRESAAASTNAGLIAPELAPPQRAVRGLSAGCDVHDWEPQSLWASRGIDHG